MKLHGKPIEGPNVVTVVIPRSSGDLVFKAQAVLDYSDFDKLCPVPQPPTIQRPGGQKSVNVEDPGYKEQLEKWAEKKSCWMVIKSLSVTEGLEWETVDLSDPDTWINHVEELTKAGLTPHEQSRLVNAFSEANGLSQDKIDEATRRFLALTAEVIPNQ